MGQGKFSSVLREHSNGRNSPPSLRIEKSFVEATRSERARGRKTGVSQHSFRGFFIASGPVGIGTLGRSQQLPCARDDQENDMRLPTQVALVTGAASGIARALAIRFAREGAAVMVADASERGAETVDQIRAGGGTALFGQLDVSQPEQ